MLCSSPLRLFGNTRGGLAQHPFVGAAECSYLARCLVNGLLRGMARMALEPFPLYLVAVGGVVESRPPFVVRLAAEAPRHRLDDVARVGHDGHAAGLAQLFEP